jgi:hypothetical protein
MKIEEEIVQLKKLRMQLDICYKEIIFKMPDMIKNHNLERHDLFFACIKLVSDNIGKPQWVIKEQVKIDCKWIKGYFHHKEGLLIVTKSISFSEMTISEANQFYGIAFDKLAEYLGISTEEMTNEAKKLMHRRF